MNQFYINKYFTFFLLVGFSLVGCNEKYDAKDYTAYFGGEIINPTSDFVILLKNNEVIDTLNLDENRRFFKTFDSLSPGMYTFKHEPEYQYVYFDKNDSLMVRINSVDFDESIVFCGRGDEKNNFLIELFLKNQNLNINSFDDYDLPVEAFLTKLDSSYQSIYSFYEANKVKLNWSIDFDFYVQNKINLHKYAKKEIYPSIHQLRTGKNNLIIYPDNYYDHRKTIDFQNDEIMHYSPMVRYLSHMLSNISFQEVNNKNIAESEKAIEMGMIKLKIADTLFKNEKIKNGILNQITFNFLLEDQNIHNIEKMLHTYNKLSTDTAKKSEIQNIEIAIQRLNKNELLPNIKLTDFDSLVIDSQSILDKKSVIVFWSENLETHLVAIHKKADLFSQTNPDYQFVFLNIDNNHGNWRNHLKKYKNPNYHYYKAKDFNKLKSEWVITKLHRTIILGDDGKIKNAFVNIFDARFEQFLK